MEFLRLSVLDYHKLIEVGVLTANDNVELLEGLLVARTPLQPPHATTIHLLRDAVSPRLPPSWCVRVQSAVTLPDSEPEPDVALARGDARTYTARHPGPADIGVLIEVSDSTLDGDRSHKGRIYARAKVPVYWIVNLIDRQIEVHEQPSGPTAAPAYAKVTTFHDGDAIPFVLDGNAVATFAVQDLLP